MTVKLLTELRLRFLSLKEYCTGLSESTLVKMPYCWKSRVTVHIYLHTICIILQEESFKIVIQQKAAYQTGNDKQIPIMCLADLNDLTVANNINAA